MSVSYPQSMALIRPSQNHRCYPHVPFSIRIRIHHRICVRTLAILNQSKLHLFHPSPDLRSDLPHFTTGVPASATSPRKSSTLAPMNFAPAGNQSGIFPSACEAPVFIPADQVLQVEFVPDMNMSDSSFGGDENRAIGVALTKV